MEKKTKTRFNIMKFQRGETIIHEETSIKYKVISYTLVGGMKESTFNYSLEKINDPTNHLIEPIYNVETNFISYNEWRHKRINRLLD